MKRQKSINIALRRVPDITESDLVSTLQFVVSHQQDRMIASPSADAMQIDSAAAGIPSLQTFLSSCITYKTSPAPLRLAIHDHLREPNHLVRVLEVIENWISLWVAKDSASSPAKGAKHDKGDLPPFAKVSVLGNIYVVPHIYYFVRLRS
jgi:hypothetical protein